MPADDLVLNVRQIASYPAVVGNAPPAGALLIQTAGLGSTYASISPEALVSTALASPGNNMFVGGQVGALSFQGGTAQFSNAAVNILDVAQRATFRAFDASWGTIAGAPIATQAFASALVAGLQAATVWSFNGRRGDVRLWLSDILAAGAAPVWSPFLQGTPMAPTPGPSSNSERLATTAFVQRATSIAIDCLLQTQPFVFSFNGRSGDVVLTAQDVIDAGATLNYAPLDSPAFTGYPTAPTAPPGSQTAQLATTAFVMNAVQESTTGVASFNGRTGLVTLSAADVTGAGGAVLASPAFTGTPSAPTAAPGTDTSQLATTAFVINELGGVTSGVESFNGRVGVVTLTLADVTNVGGAPLASPAFNGVPTAPTATSGTSTQQLATTAFVMAAVVGGSVVSFNGRTGAVTLTANDISAAGGAALNSPAFYGTPTAPTAAPGANTTQLATCAFVAAAIAAAPGVTSFNTRTGSITLSNADVIAVLPGSNVAPLVDGTASAGSSTAWSRGDHVHPTDTSRYSATNPSGFQTASQVASALAAYLPLAGGTLTGQLNGTVAQFSSSVFCVGAVSVAASPGGSPLIGFFNGPTRIGWIGWYSPSGAQLVWSNDASGGQATINADATFQISSATAFKVGGGTWTDSSDERIKTVVQAYTPGLDEVLALNPVVYRFKGNDTPTGRLGRVDPGPVQPYTGSAPYPGSPHYKQALDGTEFVGLIAQELEAVDPAMVTKSAGFIDGAAVDDLRQVNISNLVFLLVNAVKTLTARVQALEANR